MLFVLILIFMVFSLKDIYLLIIALVLSFLNMIIYYLMLFYYKLIKKSTIPESNSDYYEVECKCPNVRKKYPELFVLYIVLIIFFYFLLYIIENKYFLPEPEYFEFDGQVIELPSNRISYNLLFLIAVIFHVISEVFRKNIYYLEFIKDKILISNDFIRCEVIEEKFKGLERSSAVEIKIDFKDNTTCALLIPETEFVREKDIEIRKDIADEIMEKFCDSLQCDSGTRVEISNFT